MPITLGFIRNRRDNLIIITVGSGRTRQELRVTSELFFSIIPQANPYLYGGTVEATPAQLVELGFELDAEMKREVFRVVRPLVTPAQVRYVLDPITGNYIVRSVRRHTSGTRHTAAGVLEINGSQSAVTAREFNAINGRYEGTRIHCREGRRPD
ncbi:hypothetical protein MJ749_25325 [Paenibacillus polymyxa]|uniref:hypothetical protein n=1 Tax=Paenibacillus polymyxa TaxID=1406 RepID=UPI001F107AC9|nr:hypothetical protein [Paenibacillus polymyxa]UMR35904.1 hypothetical protein MJ749_25325 [Paenibacillus polymyxa]